MTSALMKDLHLCPMDLFVFIFAPNMVSMRSPDTVPDVSCVALVHGVREYTDVATEIANHSPALGT